MWMQDRQCWHNELLDDLLQLLRRIDFPAHLQAMRWAGAGRFLAQAPAGHCREGAAGSQQGQPEACTCHMQDSP